MIEPIAPSGMVNFTEPSPAYPDKGPELTPRDATALTTYILSARSDKIPYNYYVPGPKEAKFEDLHFSSSKEAGKWVYDRYGCAACHGLNAKGGRRNFNYRADVVGTAIRAQGNDLLDEDSLSQTIKGYGLKKEDERSRS